MQIKLISYLVITAILVSCGNKESSTPNASALQTRNDQLLIGGSITKEIIINSQSKEKSSVKVIASHFTSSTLSKKEEENNEAQKKVIVHTLEKTRTYKPYVYNNTPSLINSDIAIDMGSAGIATLLTATTGPVAGAAIGAFSVFGGEALKSYVNEKNDNPIVDSINKISDRTDTQILELATLMADQLGDQVFRDMHLGIDPKYIKENILNFKTEIYKNTDLTYEDMEVFQKSANDSLLFSYMMAINSQEIKVNKNVNALVADIRNNTKLLKEISKNTQNFIDIQNKFFAEMDNKFNSREKELFMEALYDKGTSSSGKELLTPGQLAYLKSHPEKQREYGQLLSKFGPEELSMLIKTQENAQKSLAYLQVTSQIVNNLNLNPNIANAINTGANIASTISSLASFAITSNPLSALQALSSITGMFSKPKPDPRFTAIFENFKAIQKSLQDIQYQLKGINLRLDNVDDGLSYIITQNNTIKDLINDQNTNGSDKCVLLTEIFESNRENLTFDFMTANFKLSQQGDNAKIDSCMNYLLNTFEGSTLRKNLFLADKQSSENISNDPEITKYFSTADQIMTIYSTLYPSASSVLKTNDFAPKYMLSLKQVLNHTEILLNNSFLFDIAKVNQKNGKWEIIDRSELTSTIQQNKKSQKLIENAITLIEKSLIDQSIIDGTLDSKLTLREFIYTQSAKCSDIKFKSVVCAADINPILMNNLVTKAFRDLIGFDYFWAWNQISETNPDYLNEKLINTNLKVVWVGAGSHSLFTGTVISDRPDLSSGAYIQIKGTNKLTALPTVDSIKSDSHLVISERTQVLKKYKMLLENELIERNIDKVLSAEQLNFYNAQKIDEILVLRKS